LPGAALGFAIAAVLSSWNPISAPFGLVVGIAALVLGARALALGGRRRLSAASVGVAFLAVVASVLVLALTAGVGRELGGLPVVPRPPREEVDAELDAAEERTRPARARARAELDALERPEEGEAGEQRDAGRERR
jgi:hypothetical protein